MKKNKKESQSASDEKTNQAIDPKVVARFEMALRNALGAPPKKPRKNAKKRTRKT